MVESNAPGLTLFISYASVNRAQVLSMVDALNARSIATWVDLEGITAGESYGLEIVDGIQGSQAVLLMCTERALASRNVRQEIQLAWRYERPIIPILLEQVTIPDDLAYWLEGAQWIDTTTFTDDAWIDRVLGALVKRGVTAAGVAIPPAHSAVKPMVSPPGNLDPDLKVPIGRERELRRLVSLIGNSRIVTVSGPGGVGKTTVAIEAGRRLADHFSDGIWFVDATNSTTEDGLYGEIASTLGLQMAADADVAARIRSFVDHRTVLFILDNLEQNRGAGAAISSLIEGTSDLSVLATSRVPLRIPKEAHFPLAGFEIDDKTGGGSAAEYAELPAVALYVTRARQARPEFTLTDGNSEAIVAICSRLEGLPLAIELAAARSRLLPPAAILERLDAALDLSSTSLSSRTDRQKTLRATIRWSYDLLTPGEQETFQALSVCDGGFTVEATEAICSTPEAIEHMESLLDHHLVTDRGFSSTLDTPRFRMLETVRAFAREMLEEGGNTPDALMRHMAWYCEVVAKASPIMEVGSDPAVLDELVLDHANIRRAFSTAIERERSEAAVALTNDLMRFWLTRGQLREGVQYVDMCLALDADLTNRQRGLLYQTRAILHETSGSLIAARADWEMAVQEGESSGDDALLAVALSGQGTTAEASGEYGQAIEHYQRALTIHRQLGNARGIAVSLQSLGSAELMRTNYDAARTYCAEGIRIWRSLGELLHLAYVTQQDGMILFMTGNYESALALYEEALHLLETVGDAYGIGNALINLGGVFDMTGRYSEAVPVLNRARGIFVEMGDEGGLGFTDYQIGHLLREMGDPTADARLNDALTRLTSVGDLQSLALIHESLAGLAVDRGDRRDAEGHFAEAARIRAEIEAPVPGSRVDEIARDKARLAVL